MTLLRVRVSAIEYEYDDDDEPDPLPPETMDVECNVDGDDEAEVYEAALDAVSTTTGWVVRSARVDVMTIIRGAPRHDADDTD